MIGIAKTYDEIIEWGTLKPFFDKTYHFNSIDIETVDNELFLFGFIKDGNYHYVMDNFYNTFHDLLIESLQDGFDILTWSRYDNTHLLKLIIQKLSLDEINTILKRVGKISPIITYTYRNFTFTIDNIIKDSIIFTIESDKGGKKKNKVIIYNLKNLYTTDLTTTANNYKIDYYSKIGEEYHIIDKNRFYDDLAYKNNVILSNKLDNKVIIDIANKMLESFKEISGVYPKTIYTNGSISRSYLMAYMINSDIEFKLPFKSIFKKGSLSTLLLKESMRSYHGGKIESYVLGFIPQAKIIDITSAYPYAYTLLEQLTGKIVRFKDVKQIKDYYYAFIKCDIHIRDGDLIHPLSIPSPINLSNISPYGYLENITITKIEYDYLLSRGVSIKVKDVIACESIKEYPYKPIINTLFNQRMITSKTNKSVSEMNKTILNSMYGIVYELTPIYEEDDKGNIDYKGLRAGDFFNPVLASYITALTRTYLSRVSQNILDNNGNVFLNMTDSIIYEGDVTLDVFSETKTLGYFEKPEIIKDVIILGSGRYEYYNDFTKKYTIKSRGFSVSQKESSFYGNLELSDKVTIDHRTFVTAFKATTNKYSYQQMGHLIDDTYDFNPFNLGGKRIILNPKVNLNKAYTKTKAIYIEKGVL